MKALTLFLFFSIVSAQGFAQSSKSKQKKAPDKKTRIIYKAPKKQKFEFQGSEIKGQADVPAESVISSRTTSTPTSLIPERSSFRREVVNSYSRPPLKNK